MIRPATAGLDMYQRGLGAAHNRYTGGEAGIGSVRAPEKVIAVRESPLGPRQPGQAAGEPKFATQRLSPFWIPK